MSKICGDFEIFDIFEKLVRNWPISKNARSLANFEDIGVWFFAYILLFIVELNCELKIGDKSKTNKNILFFGTGVPISKGRTGVTPQIYSKKNRLKRS
jgi:hypothetical protein